MARPYTNSIAAVAASFPGAAYTPIEFRNEDLNGYDVVSEAFTVPSDPDGDGKYRLELDFIPLEQSTFEISVDGNALTVIPWGETPSADEVALSLETGAVEFHSSLADLEGEASYRARGSDLTSQVFNRVQRELAAVQAASRLMRMAYGVQFFGEPGGATASGDERKITVGGPTGALWKTDSVQIIHAEKFSATAATVIRISKTGVGATAGNYIECQVANNASQGTLAFGALYIDQGEHLYAYVQTAGGHQNIQVMIHLAPR